VFGQHPSLYRFLLKATRTDPTSRFQSADEMAGQLQGVLRDVAAGTGVLAPVDSAVFDADIPGEGDNLWGDGIATHRLPSLRPVATDPATPAIIAAAMVPDPRRRLALLEAAWADHPDSLDLPYRLAGAALEGGAPDSVVNGWLSVAENAQPGDWRSSWLKGQLALARGDAPTAMHSFDIVLAELPGELAPKLALGYAYELAGQLDPAAGYFDLVSRADPTYTSAAFGLARCQRRRGDRAGAVAALERVPSSSSRYESARVAMVEVLLDDDPRPPAEDELARAAEVLAQLEGAAMLAVHRLAARLLLDAARALEGGGGGAMAGGGGGAPGTGTLLGIPRRVDALRAGAERELRTCAHLAATREERIRYVDEANRARPFTLV
jgi:serine/threonine-protein kinase PknG